MKETYMAPEVRMIGFQPAEALSVIDFDDMLYAAAGKLTDADPSTSDVSVDLAR